MLKKDSMVFKSVCLLAVISVALYLIPAGAHFFELANKMSLSTAEYMTTQKIYAGWSLFGVAIIAAIAFTLDAHFNDSRQARGLSSVSWRS
jgi:hypothetical protein